MSTAINIVLNDGQATPVAHTFVPQDRLREGGGVMYQDISSGVPDQYPTLMIRGWTSSNGIFRALRIVEVPILETVTGSNAQGYQALTKLAFKLRARTEYTIDGRSTLASRKDLAAYDKNLNSNAVMTDLLQSFGRPY